MTDDRYRSPLGTRYASPEMQRLWGERVRIGLWRRVWLALAESERELGLDIPPAALAEMRAHLDDFLAFKAARPAADVRRALDQLARAANDPRDNVFARVVEAAEAGCTHGEVCATLRRELGFGHVQAVV